MAETMKVYVNQDTPRSNAEGSEMMAKGSKRGELCVLDFFMAMLLEGRGFQVVAGAAATLETGDQPVADTAAEFCADIASGYVIIPIFFNVALVTQDGSDHEIYLCSVGTVSSAGTAQTPLPLLMGSTVAAVATARMDDEGGVTVTAGAVTSTRRHFSVGGGSIADLVYHDCVWDPLKPPPLMGAACVYAQIGATTTGPDYMGNLDFIELPTAAIS